jgi:hypothetical protein
MPTDQATIPAPAYRPLGQAIRRLGTGRGGRPIHVATATRWATEGVRLADGSRLRLKALRLPGRWVTTDEWVDEFTEALTADRIGQSAPAPPRPSAEWQRRQDRTEAELVAKGL